MATLLSFPPRAFGEPIAHVDAFRERERLAWRERENRAAARHIWRGR